MRLLRNLLVCACLLAIAFAAAPASGDAYAAGFTFVARSGGTLVDNGILVCVPGEAGVGGACVPWGAGDSLLVLDASLGDQVAFSVCVDNDGDGFCTQGASLARPGCDDQISFSHSDGGAFYNPLGPLPTSFKSGCPGGFPGWVVFLCSGAHADGAVHAHQATSGTITPNWAGTGYGNFCGNGGTRERSDLKAYVVASPGASSFTQEEIVIQRNGTLPPSISVPPGLSCGSFVDPVQVAVHCNGPASSRCIATRVDVAVASGGPVTGRSECPGVVAECTAGSSASCAANARGSAPPSWTCRAFSPNASSAWEVRCKAIFAR